jgi:hypothetical protein
MVARLPGEEIVHVARAVDDMYDVHVAARSVFIGIAEKNQIVAESRAAITTAQLGSRASHKTGKSGDVLTKFCELVYERVGDGPALTLTLDVSGYLGDIATSRGQVNERRTYRDGV